MPGAFGRQPPGYKWDDDEDGMKMRAFLSYAAAGIAVGFALGGCPALDALSGDLVLRGDFFPLVDQAQWVYEVTKDGSAVGTASLTLTDVKTTDEGVTGEGTLTLVVPLEAGGNATIGYEIRKTAESVQLSGQQPLIKLPVRLGDSWTAGATSDIVNVQAAQEPQVAVVGTQRVDFTFGGEKVSSPSVRVDLKAFGLTEEGEADTSKLRSSILRRWFVAGVGMVRMTSGLAPFEGYTLQLLDVTGI